MDKINLKQKLSLFSEPWQPKIVGELNGQYVKLVKFQGPFTWHHHETEDEMFMVIKGRFRMEFRERERVDREGEFIIVPRVRASSRCHEKLMCILFEPASTLNTGNVRTSLRLRSWRGFERRALFFVRSVSVFSHFSR